MAQAVASAHRQSIHMFRKHIVFICYLFLLAGCATHEEMNDVKARLEALESTRIATVEEQVQSIRRSLTELESTDAALKDYISALEEGAGKLQESIDDASSRIAAMDALIIDLKEKDAELEGRIDALREYVDKQIKESKDWASATFSTLEQYNATVQELADIKADIIAVGENLNDLDKELTGKMEAQATAFNAALASLESGLKQWVNEKLKSYCTIAEADAKLRVLELSVQEGDEQLAKELKALQGDLATQKADITAAYKQAIATAISENNGVIDGKIAAAVKEVNDKIDGAIETINGQLADLDLRLKGVEKSVAEILSMIQSIAVVPTYSDGAVAVGESETVIYFEIFPLEAAKKMEEIALTAFSLKAVSTTQTKADVNFVSLPVLGVKYEDGLVAVSTSGEALDAAFFDGIDSMNARLSISDGASALTSPYFSIAPQGDRNVIKLRAAAALNKAVTSIVMESTNDLMIGIENQAQLVIKQKSSIPILYLDQEGYWCISYNCGSDIARIKDGQDSFIQHSGDNARMVKLVVDNNGTYCLAVSRATDATTVIEEMATTCTADAENTISSIFEDELAHQVTITMTDGTDYLLARKYPAPNGVFVNNPDKLTMTKGRTKTVTFRVNPSNAHFEYDMTSEVAEIALDLVGQKTKASNYVTTPENYTLEKVEKMCDEEGNVLKGQYTAYISDSRKSTEYDEQVSFVISTVNGEGETIQLSSPAFAIGYANSFIKRFEFKVMHNQRQLQSDLSGDIIGDKIFVRIPHTVSDKQLIPQISIEGEGKLVRNDKGNKSEDIAALTNFAGPVVYEIVDEETGEVLNSYEVEVTAYTGLPIINIYTENDAKITSKTEYVNAWIEISNAGKYDFAKTAVQIRGRGNSTWGMPKKPYRLKFDKKQSLFGEPKDKSWVLLANYSDKTKLRNPLAFYMGDISKLDWTPCSHQADLFLNHVYQGTYQLSEHIKISEDRVNVTDDGFLLEVETPSRIEAGDVYFTTPRILLNIKDPDVEQDSEKYNEIKNYVTNAENVLYGDDWLDEETGYKTLMDIESFAEWYIINEIAKNNDAIFYSSCYMNYAPGGKLKMGPVWDFDIGFGNINYNGNQEYYGWWIRNAVWIKRMFADPEFVALVKARLAYYISKTDELLSFINTESQYLHYSVIEDNYKWDTFYNYTWPNYAIVGAYENEVAYLKEWLIHRLEWLDSAINNL